VRSGALLGASGILAAMKGDHQDFIALLSEVDGIGKPPHHELADLPVKPGEPQPAQNRGMTSTALPSIDQRLEADAGFSDG
jgi:hypothetical protein